MAEDGNRAESTGIHVPGEKPAPSSTDNRAPSLRPSIPPPEGDYFDEGEEPRVSLGPLGLLGFGPPPSVDPRRDRGGFGPNALLTAASLVVVIAALKVARPVLLPLTVSAFLAVLTAPFVLYLKRHRVPPHFGVPIVVLVTVLLLSGVAGLVVGTLNAFVQEIPAYQARVMDMLTSASNQLESWGYHLTLSSLSSLIQPAAAMAFAGNTLSQIADLLSNTFLVLLMTIFVLFEAMVLPDKIRSALSDPNADLSQGLRVVTRIKQYVVIKTSTSLATGVIIGGALELLGVDFALLWGLLAFLFNFIPNIGSIIAAIPAIILALLQAGPTGALATAIVFVVVNMVIGSLLEPKIMGERMNLSPLVVFVSLVFWGWLWGPIGMLLSVPLTMAIRIMLEGNPSTRPLAILLAGATRDDEPPPTVKSG